MEGRSMPTLEDLDLETMRGSCPWFRQREGYQLCLGANDCSIANCAILYWARVLLEGLGKPKEP